MGNVNGKGNNPLYPTNLIERILKPMIIDKVASETIGKMLKEGYDLSLTITSYPEYESGIESFYVMFYTDAFVEPGERLPKRDLRDFLMAYSGDRNGTVSEAIQWAADSARLATKRGLTFRYAIPDGPTWTEEESAAMRQGPSKIVR